MLLQSLMWLEHSSQCQFNFGNKTNSPSSRSCEQFSLQPNCGQRWLLFSPHSLFSLLLRSSASGLSLSLWVLLTRPGPLLSASLFGGSLVCPQPSNRKTSAGTRGPIRVSEAPTHQLPLVSMEERKRLHSPDSESWDSAPPTRRLGPGFHLYTMDAPEAQVGLSCLCLCSPKWAGFMHSS